MIGNIIQEIPNDYLPISEVCYKLGMTQITLTRWYNWYEDNYQNLPENFPKLPNYYRATQRGTRYFKPDAIEQIREFSKNVHRGRTGIMASENRKYIKKS